MTESKALARLDAERAVVVVVDVQERLARVMQGRERLIARLAALVAGARLLGMPLIFTEQNPRGLGSTVSELQARPAEVIEKLTFSCAASPPFLSALRATERSQVVLAGIEAHICVAQTGIDLLRRGYDLFLVEDAVQTRLIEALPAALQRLRAAGVVSTTVEAALFEAQREASGDRFKALLGLVREMS